MQRNKGPMPNKIQQNMNGRARTPMHPTNNFDTFHQHMLKEQGRENSMKLLIPQFGLTSKIPESQKSVINMV